MVGRLAETPYRTLQLSYRWKSVRPCARERETHVTRGRHATRAQRRICRTRGRRVLGGHSARARPAGISLRLVFLSSFSYLSFGGTERPGLGESSRPDGVQACNLRKQRVQPENTIQIFLMALIAHAETAPRDTTKIRQSTCFFHALLQRIVFFSFTKRQRKLSARLHQAASFRAESHP